MENKRENKKESNIQKEEQVRKDIQKGDDLTEEELAIYSFFKNIISFIEIQNKDNELELIFYNIIPKTKFYPKNMVLRFVENVISTVHTSKIFKFMAFVDKVEIYMDYFRDIQTKKGVLHKYFYRMTNILIFKEGFYYFNFFGLFMISLIINILMIFQRNNNS